jgi:hypothetical protein
MNEECARATMECSDFLNRLRPIRRVNRVLQPVTRGDGTIELLAVGYDAESAIYSFDEVIYDTDMDFPEAWMIINRYLSDVPFADADSDRSSAATVAMFLAPFADCLFPDGVHRPAFIVQGNAVGCGKSTLIEMALTPVFGEPVFTAVPSPDKMGELINTIAQARDAYVFLDNWRGPIANQALESFISSPRFGGRILGTSFKFRTKKQAIIFISANDANPNDDIADRSLRIELFVEEIDPAMRKISRRLGRAELAAERPAILGSLWSFIRMWITKGSKPGKTEPHRYAEWGKVIGGILQACAFGDPFTKPVLTFGGESTADAFEKIFKVIGQDEALMKSNPQFLKPAELLDYARLAAVFAWFLDPEAPDATTTGGEKQLRGERKRFASQCRQVAGRRFLSGIRFDEQGEHRNKRYSITWPDSAVPLVENHTLEETAQRP